MTDFVMKVKKLEEAGHHSALWGLMMNKHKGRERNLGTLQKIEKVSQKLADKDADTTNF